MEVTRDENEIQTTCFDHPHGRVRVVINGLKGTKGARLDFSFNSMEKQWLLERPPRLSAACANVGEETLRQE